MLTQLGTELDPEQADRLSQNLAEKLVQQLKHKWESDQADGLSSRKRNCMRYKLTGRSIESVVQTAGVRSDETYRQIEFGLDTASVQDSGACEASRVMRVQVSLGRGSWSSVCDSWQVFGVG